MPSHPEHLHHLVAEMVDDLDGNLEWPLSMSQAGGIGAKTPKQR